VYFVYGGRAWTNLISCDLGRGGGVVMEASVIGQRVRRECGIEGKIFHLTRNIFGPDEILKSKAAADCISRETTRGFS